MLRDAALAATFLQGALGKTLKTAFRIHLICNNAVDSDNFGFLRLHFHDASFLLFDLAADGQAIVLHRNWIDFEKVRPGEPGATGFEEVELTSDPWRKLVGERLVRVEVHPDALTDATGECHQWLAAATLTFTNGTSLVYWNSGDNALVNFDITWMELRPLS